MHLFLTIITLGIFWQPSLDYMYKHATTPQKISQCLWYFNRIKDKTEADEYKSPEHFILDKGGDCDDYAVIAYVLLKRIGYDPTIMKLHNPYDDRDYGHAICIVNENLLFSNDKLIKMSLIEYMVKNNWNICIKTNIRGE